jgi:iron complex outermembrane recepter protein
MRRSTHGQLLRLIALSPVGLIATPTLAQQAPEGEDPVAEEIIVTSSRIRRSEDTFSNPVLAIPAESIQYSGTTSLATYLKETPALAGSQDANDNAGSNAQIGTTGLSLLDLRNLGVERTLVLVDGRRHVAALPGTAAIDVDTIPIALVERIEVQTGGASAIYGADGVSGVVNFIMKKDFEGVDVRAQMGRSGHGDADSRLFSAAAGLNFHEGRGNVTFALEHASEDRLHASRRDFAGGGSRHLLVDNPFDRNDDPNVYDHIPLNDVRFWDSSPNGAIDVELDFVNDFDGDGTPWDFGVLPPVDGSAPVPPIYAQGGDGTPLDRYIGDLLPEIERSTANLFVNYELAPAATVFGELKFSRSESFSEAQPTFDFFLWLEPDYAFTPANIAAAGAGGPIFMSRDNFDLGVRNEDIDRETLRGVLGIGGDITDNVRYEASYVYGETEVDNHIGNNRYNDRFAAALDAVVDPATGDIVCRSNLDPSAEPANISWQGWNTYEPIAGTWAGSFTPGPNSGCVPLNLFGEGSPSQEAIDWIMLESFSTSKITQEVVQAFVSGSTADWFELPAGPLGFALGAEWRKEESESMPPLEDQLGQTFGNILLPSRGDYDVAEAFAEISVPLLANRPFAEILSVDGAVRLSDYSTIGSATTWKAGVIWSPIRSIALRGTLAEATRAPNIAELFDPGGQDFQLINDPCDRTRLDEGSSTRAANCEALLTALGVDPGSFTDPNSASVAGVSQGNPNLEEEIAETTTIGIVLRPEFAPSLAISIDWYDVELTSAIASATPEEAAQICVDSPTLDNDFCGLITREPGTGAIASFLTLPVNVADFRTEGYDFTVNYQLDPADIGMQRDIGLFDFRLIGNKLEELTFIRLPGAEPDPELGEEDKPEWQMNLDVTWQLASVLVNYGINYFDETYRYTYQQRRADTDIVAPAYYKYDARFTHDVQMRYAFDNGLAVYGGVNNLTDQEPDLGEDFYPVSAVGRFWYLGATFSRF